MARWRVCHAQYDTGCVAWLMTTILTSIHIYGFFLLPSNVCYLVVLGLIYGDTSRVASLWVYCQLYSLGCLLLIWTPYILPMPSTKYMGRKKCSPSMEEWLRNVWLIIMASSSINSAMSGASLYLPSAYEYYQTSCLTEEKLKLAIGLMPNSVMPSEA